MKQVQSLLLFNRNTGKVIMELAFPKRISDSEVEQRVSSFISNNYYTDKDGELIDNWEDYSFLVYKDIYSIYGGHTYFALWKSQLFTYKVDMVTYGGVTLETNTIEAPNYREAERISNILYNNKYKLGGIDVISVAKRAK